MGWVGLAYQDTGLSKEDTEKKLNTLENRIEYYSDTLEKINAQELKEKGVFFFLIESFTNLITDYGTHKLNDKSFREKYFAIFDLGKQAYKNDEKIFEDLIKDVKFLDE